MKLHFQRVSYNVGDKQYELQAVLTVHKDN